MPLKVEKKYESVRKLIDTVAIRFWEKYRGDREEIFAESRLHFMKAFRTYNKRHAKFSTYVWLKVWNGLLDTKRKQARQASKLNKVTLEFSTVKKKEKFELDKFLSQISDDARFVVDLALNPTPSTEWYLKQKDYRRQLGQVMRKIIKSQLRRRGWNSSRIVSAFKEVRETLP